jgi:DUF1680 family protein
MNSHQSSNYSRRKFLQIAGAAGVGTLASRSILSAVPHEPTPDRYFEHGQPLQEFEYSQVEFAPGLHETQLEQTRAVVANMDEDGMLHSFRRYAGLPTPGCPMPGHYDLLNAESFGCFVSALARYHAIKGDEAIRTKVERLVREYAQTVEPTGKIFPKTTGVLANAVSFPKYSRIVRALVDAHQFTKNTFALEVLARTTDTIMPKLTGEVGRDSTAGWNLLLPETEFLAWQYTGDARHLDIATRYLYQDFFDRLARGENCLGGRNALAHVNALGSAAKAYLVLGQERYLQAAKNGFAFIEAQSYATGGWGPNECFLPQTIPWGEPIEKLAKGWMPEIKTLGGSLTRTHWHFQTASAADAHFTLARYLLRITKEPVYGDSMERVMYNTVLGSLPLKSNGMSFCNSDYHNDGHKVYFDNYGLGNTGPEWPLEAGVLPLVATDYRINTYLRDDDGIYVNWFIPSTLKWQQGGAEVSLKQTGTYPLGDKITFTVETPQPLGFTLRLRIPVWADRASIRVNGRLTDTQVKPGSFASLVQQWRSGDRIELLLPRELRLKPVDSEHPDLVALVYEPLVLFAVTTETPQFTREQLLSAEREGEESHVWQVKVAGRSIRFMPFTAVKYERYSTYVSVTA